MCIKPSQVQVDTDHPSDCVQSLELTKHRVKQTMPKKYHPYQQVTKPKEIRKGPKVVCKNVGSNGTIFIVQDDASDQEDLSYNDKTVVVKEEDIEDIVDVEKVDQESPFVLSAKVQELQNNFNIKQEFEEKPERVANEEPKQELLTDPAGTPTHKPSNTKSTPPAFGGTVAFVSILLHALKCIRCEQPACRKMTMVLKHYKSCAFKRNSSLTSGQGWTASIQNCKICGQLLRIVAQHAKFDCKLPADQLGCPVLMCDTFRMAHAANIKKKQMLINNNNKISPELELKIKQQGVTRIPTTAVRRNGMTQPV